MRYTTLLLTILICAPSLAGFYDAAECRADDDPVEASAEMSEFQDVVKRLKTLGEPANFSDEERKQMISDIDVAFSELQKARTPIIADNVQEITWILSRLDSYNLGDRKAQNILIQRIVVYSLRANQDLNTEAIIDLVSRLRINEFKNRNEDGVETQGDEWRTLRNELVRYRLEYWLRIETAIDPDWDPENPLPVVRNVFAPGVKYPGMPPSEIADPVLRAQYETAIRKNDENNRKNREQREIRKLSDRYLPTLKRVIASYYKHDPTTDEDLNALSEQLQTYVSDEVFRMELLEAARAAAQEARPPDTNSDESNSRQE